MHSIYRKLLWVSSFREPLESESIKPLSFKTSSFRIGSTAESNVGQNSSVHVNRSIRSDLDAALRKWNGLTEKKESENGRLIRELLSIFEALKFLRLFVPQLVANQHLSKVLFSIINQSKRGMSFENQDNFTTRIPQVYPDDIWEYCLNSSDTTTQNDGPVFWVEGVGLSLTSLIGITGNSVTVAVLNRISLDNVFNQVSWNSVCFTLLVLCADRADFI